MSRRTVRVLLLEDDHEDAFLFQRRCSDRIAVHHVTTATRALATLADGTFDACFVDYRLGADSGLEFVRTARTRYARIPLIVITGLQIEVLGENALLAGATNFIPKEHLDASTIERTVRWALIRRHVEVHQEHQDRATIISRLMGRAPPDTGKKQTSESLRRLGYLSVARQPLTPSDLPFMSSRFASANARMGISGLLVYAGERFLQIIEGHDSAVEVLLRRIQGDSRHTRMHIILDESTCARLFDEWHMGLMDAAALGPGSAAFGATAAVAVRLHELLGDSTSRSSIERLLLALPGLT